MLGVGWGAKNVPQNNWTNFLAISDHFPRKSFFVNFFLNPPSPPTHTHPPETRDAWMTMASKVGKRGGEEGGGEGKDVTIAGPTNKRINKQGKIELLSQLTMEG